MANFCSALLNIFSKQFISSNTKCQKRMLNFVWNTWKFWWNETDDEVLPAFPQNHWTLKFIFSRSSGKLFFGVFMYLTLRKCKNDCKILKITLVQIFVHLNLKLLDLLSDFVSIYSPGFEEEKQSSLDTPYSSKLRHGSVVTFLENVKGGGGWCTFLGFVHNGINSW